MIGIELDVIKHNGVKANVGKSVKAKLKKLSVVIYTSITPQNVSTL